MPRPPTRDLRKHLATLRRLEREGVIDRPDDFIRAIDAFSKQAEADPALAAAAGRRFFELELESASQAIREHPNDATNYLRRAELRRLLGDAKGARADLERALCRLPARSPERRRVARLLGRAR